MAEPALAERPPRGAPHRSGPGRERDLLIQSLKAAVAAVIAWVIASIWPGAPLLLEMDRLLSNLSERVEETNTRDAAG